MMRRVWQRVNFDAIALSSFMIVGAGTLWQANSVTVLEDAAPCADFLPTSPAPAPAYRKPFHISKDNLDTLHNDGIVVLKDVFAPEQLQEMRKAADSIHAEGRMDVTANKKTVRQDRVCWIRASDGLDNDDKSEPLPLCLLEGICLLQEIGIFLERAGYSRSSNHKVPQQCQLARYDGDRSAQYVAHRDAMPNSLSAFFSAGLLGWLKTSDYRKRCITAILYLNKPDWNMEEDGGSLCCYIGADEEDDIGHTATNIKRINPVGGTLVIFDSSEILHAVEPSDTCRYALTLWITGDRNDMGS